MGDIDIALTALLNKQKKYDKLWDYYDGNQPLIYSSRILARVFNRLDARFVQPWIAVIVDCVIDRLRFKRFNLENNRLNDSVNQITINTELFLDAYDTHLAMLVTGESFIIIWPDEDNQIEAYYNDPRLCHIEYDPDSPRRKRFAAKWWLDIENKRRLILYYPDRLEHYVSRGIVKEALNVQTMVHIETTTNPYGRIPIFHFRRERRKICGEFEKVISLQDAINKLLADMMISAEFGAYPQRWIISNSEVETLRNAPDEIWDLPASDGKGQNTEVGEFNAIQLNNFYDQIEKLANSMAIITRTPKHFLYGQGGTPSGEALIAMEAPLNDKAKGYIHRISPVWQSIGQFLLQLSGVNIDKQEIQVIFDNPQTVQPLTLSQIRETNKRAGYPLTSQLRDEGKSEEEIEQIIQDWTEEIARSQQSVASGMLNAQRMLDGGQASNGMEQPE